MKTEKTKEIQVLEKEVSKELSVAQSIIITNIDEMNTAAEIRKNIKEMGKRVKAEKEKATKPLKDVLDTVKGWFSPIEDNYKEAETLITSKMTKYQQEVEEKRVKAEKIAQDKIDAEKAKLEAGKIDETQYEKALEKAETKLEKVEEVTTKTKDFHTRAIKKMRIVDESLLPRKYLSPNEVLIRKDILAGVEIPGAELYEDKTLV